MTRRSVGMAASAAAVFLVACGGGAAPEPARPATEEVPVGYGTRPGADVTGAVRSVPEAELEAGGHFTDVLEFLQGRVAGLQVVDLGGGNVSLRIRGVNQSLQERYLEPLLVIDEMPVAAGNVGVALRALRPQDVSSVQVLKDVSSTAIYGTRGANGVILIRLRRG